MHPCFILCESSVLRLCEFPIRETLSLANHYYLSEYADFNRSLGWGPQGLEVRGSIRITAKEVQRVEQFIKAARYSIAVNNCEHFAHYVLYGLNISRQTSAWWNGFGAEVIALLQPVQKVSDNVNDYIGEQVSEILNANLRRARIEKANQSRIEFWRARGIGLE